MRFTVKTESSPFQTISFSKSTAQVWLMAVNFLCIESLFVGSLLRCCHSRRWCNLSSEANCRFDEILSHLKLCFIRLALSEFAIKFSCRIKRNLVRLSFDPKIHLTLSIFIQITYVREQAYLEDTCFGFEKCYEKLSLFFKEKLEPFNHNGYSSSEV